MSVRMCMRCFELYRENTDFKHCPKNTCYGDIAEIDDLMIPIIKKLNQLGYTTRYCCSGHAYEVYPDPYIKFNEGIVATINTTMVDLPKLWVNEGNGCIRYIKYTDDKAKVETDELKKYEAILKANLDLLKYVYQLKEIEE